MNIDQSSSFEPSSRVAAPTQAPRPEVRESPPAEPVELRRGRLVMQLHNVHLDQGICAICTIRCGNPGCVSCVVCTCGCNYCTCDW